MNRKTDRGELTIELINDMGSHSSLHEALIELKSLQDFLTDSSTKYFGKLLSKIVGVDTIPFVLYKNDGLLTHIGVDRNKKTGKEESFTTNYFRIESIEKVGCRASISLLRPFDIEGDDAKELCDVFTLRKTSTCIEVDLSYISAIQPIDIELLKRKIIIEPKW